MERGCSYSLPWNHPVAPSGFHGVRLLMGKLVLRNVQNARHPGKVSLRVGTVYYGYGMTTDFFGVIC